MADQIKSQLYSWADRGWLTRLLVLSGFPAFLVEAAILSGLKRFEINEVTLFMISMPLLIVAWYHLAGRLIDRCVNKLSRQPH